MLMVPNFVYFLLKILAVYTAIIPIDHDRLNRLLHLFPSFIYSLFFVGYFLCYHTRRKWLRKPTCILTASTTASVMCVGVLYFELYSGR